MARPQKSLKRIKQLRNAKQSGKFKDPLVDPKWSQFPWKPRQSGSSGRNPDPTKIQK